MDGYYLKKCMEFKLIMNKIDNIKEYNLSGPAAIDGYSPAQLDRFEWKNRKASDKKYVYTEKLAFILIELSSRGYEIDSLIKEYDRKYPAIIYRACKMASEKLKNAQEKTSSLPKR